MIADIFVTEYDVHASWAAFSTQGMVVLQLLCKAIRKLPLGLW